MTKQKIKKIALISSYVIVALSVFIGTLIVKFPVSYIKENAFKMIEENSGVKIKAQKLELEMIMPGIRLEDVNVTLPGSMQNEKLALKELSIRPSILGLIMQKMKGEIALKGFGGSLNSNFSISPEKIEIAAQGNKINIEEISPLIRMVPIDIGAIINLDGDVSLASNKLTTLNGKGEFKITEFKVKNQNFFGLNLPELLMKNSEIKFSSKAGVLSLTKGKIGSSGDDIEGDITGNITLQDNFGMSKLDLTVKFKFSKKTEDAIAIVSSFLGVKNKEGYYAYKITGSVDLPIPTPIQ